MSKRPTKETRNHRILFIALFVLVMAFFAVPATAVMYDITASNSMVQIGNSYWFQQTPTESTGTGNYDPFLTIGGSKEDKCQSVGLNGNGGGQFDEARESADWTHALLLSTVSQREYGGEKYREFFIDLNQEASVPDVGPIPDGALITLDHVQLFKTDSLSPNYVGTYTPDVPYVYTDGAYPGSFSVSPAPELIWSMDDEDWVKMANRGSGSGHADTYILIPETEFDVGPECNYGGMDCEVWVIWFNRFGAYACGAPQLDCPAKTPACVNDGFEETTTITRPYVTVEKTAVPEYSREYTWEITKSVDPAELSRFICDSGTPTYSVTATKTGYEDFGVKVSGTITITYPLDNPGGVGNSGSAEVGDLIDTFTSNDGTITQAGTITGCTYKGASISPPVGATHFSIPAGDSIICNYQVTGLAAAKDGVNTATAKVFYTDPSAFTFTFTDTADVIFTGANPTTVLYNTVHVTDTFLGPLGEFTSGQTKTYPHAFLCDCDPESYTEGYYDYTQDNTACIDEFTDPEVCDSASELVKCYAPLVSKDGAGTYDEHHDWNVLKTVNPTSVKGFAGDDLDYDWTVVASDNPTFDNFAINGHIYVENPSPPAMTMVANLKDNRVGSTGSIGPCIDGTLGPKLPDNSYSLSVVGGKTATCDYTVPLSDKTTTSNTATVTLNTVLFSNTATIGWTATVFDKDATLTDGEGLNEALTGTSSPQTFTFNVGNRALLDDGYICPSSITAYTNGVKTDSDSNTATITYTSGHKDSTANEAITCYAPLVTKDGAGTYDEIHHWNVLKTVNPTSVKGFAGDDLDYDWTVVASDNPTFENFAASGHIYVKNPSIPSMTMHVHLVDMLGSTAATIGPCVDGTLGAKVGDYYPLDIVGGKTATCDYSVTLSSSDTVLNTATATLNSIPFSGSATVTSTAHPIDKDATLTDGEGLNEALTGTSSPQTFTFNVGNRPILDDGYICPTNPSAYTDGVKTDSDSNTATITYASGHKDSTANEAITCYAPTVTKTAQTYKTKNWDWQIDKTVTPGSVSLKFGDQGEAKWVIVATPIALPDSGFMVKGQISVVNHRPLVDMPVSIKDALSDTTVATITSCTGGTLGAKVGDYYPLTVPGGGTAICDYEASPGTGTATSNTATVMLDGLTTTGSHGVDWTTAIVTQVNAQVEVWDKFDDMGASKFGDAYASDGPTTFAPYYRVFACEQQESVNYPNKACIVTAAHPFNTKPEWCDTALFNKICNPLLGSIEKTADTEWTRKYTWTIDKEAYDVNNNLIPPEGIVLATGETYTVVYKATVTQSAPVDSLFLVSGTITLTNGESPSALTPRPYTIDSFSDVINPGGIEPTSITDCVIGTVLDEGDVQTCDYSMYLSAAPGFFGTNEATVSFEYPTYFKHADGSITPLGTETFTPEPPATADITFDATANHIWDKCVNVKDVFEPGEAGEVTTPLGQFCGSGSHTFSYNVNIGSFTECGPEFEVNNCADYITVACGDTGCVATPLIGSDCHVIPVEIPCVGCTLTPGYWMTHSECGPAPYDEGWLNAPDGTLHTYGPTTGGQTEFYDSCQTWWGVFRTSPGEGAKMCDKKGSNVYYKLSFQFMAAELNTWNDAYAPTPVSQAITWADNFFDTYTPCYIAGLKGNDPLVAQVNYYHGILSHYNEGIIGPGHCDESYLNTGIRLNQQCNAFAPGCTAPPGYKPPNQNYIKIG